MARRRKPHDPSAAIRADNERKEREAERARLEAQGSGVYVIGPESGPQKVGVAIDPAARLSTLQTGCPDPLRVHHFVVVGPHARLVEAEAHRILAARHHRGEWFSVTPDEAREAIDVAILTAPRVSLKVPRRRAPQEGRRKWEPAGGINDGLAIQYARNLITDRQLEAALAYRQVRRKATANEMGRPNNSADRQDAAADALLKLHRIEGEVIRKADVAGLRALLQIAWRGEKTVHFDLAALQRALDVVALLLDLHSAKAA